ncbi:Carbonyl reductase [NADPH] 3 (NADPH-dependent carbonyl reductase 3) [Durusdinium trenchii]|uniref:Carbonyl reductase [NADPH] 3 (NADPH-dependent carbonyl reductase 3) n=1 Tax=Durusdinium trenchii TaxID=1381693 RepID=A0ABP0JWA3_9DINO
MAGETAAKGTMGIFIIFVLSRALHPMVIDYSKEDGKMLYSKNSPAIMSQLLSMVFVNFLAWQEEGMKGVKACWQIPKGASIFILIGLWYAFGDFLEMLSMGAMTGGVYQLLLQSKLLITAVMMKQLKGTTQSDLQWNVLIAATLAISAFVMVDSGSGSGEGSLPLMGVAMVLLKVGVSCYAAVLSDAKLKGFSNMSMSAKLSLMSLSRVIASVGIAAVMEPSVQPSYQWSAAGFFDHWTLATWIVTVSFTSKSLITLYLLKSLDGIQKNVGEALAVIVIFLGQIAAGSSVFNLCAFLLACLVVILVRIYGLAGKVKAKAIEMPKAKDAKVTEVKADRAEIVAKEGMHFVCEQQIQEDRPAHPFFTAMALILVTGAARGLGVGICRQLRRQAPEAQLLVGARRVAAAQSLAEELGAMALELDVADEASCQRAAEQVARLREGRPLVVVHNAGVAFDLPWFEAPWPAEAARKTLDVNLFGCIRLTSALLPELLATGAGRLVVVSSGAGAANLSKMSEERRQQLMAADEMGIQRMCEEFVKDYEASAREQAEKPLPILSDSGFWLQSYGFSKACLNRWCQVMAEQHSGRLISVACSPGFVETEMVKSYKGDSKLKSVDEGGDLCAWLACSPAVENGYYNPDRTRAS